MWLFLSRRLRMWVIFAVGLPVARSVVLRAATEAQTANPNGRLGPNLFRVAGALGVVSARPSRILPKSAAPRDPR
jgi:hypothetical protein